VRYAHEKEGGVKEIFYRKSWLYIAPLAGALALAGATQAGGTNASPESSFKNPQTLHSSDQNYAPPMKYVGVQENDIWTRDEKRAEKIAKMIADSGFNTVRVVVPIGPTQAEINNDMLPTCIAAKAAYDNGLALVLTYQGYDIKQAPGYVPQSSSEITRFITVSRAYMEALAGPTKDESPTGPYRCESLPKKMDLNFEIMNEPNIPLFFNAENAPQKLVNILARVYPALKKEAYILGTHVNIMAGALSSRHNVLGFIAAMGEAIRARGIKAKLFDIWTEHPFGLNSAEPPATIHPDGSVIGIADYTQQTEALRRAFGFVPPIIYSEWGAQTLTPPGKQSLYKGQLSPAVGAVDESTQARYITQAYSLAACQPKVLGLFNFHAVDVADEAATWRASGLFYPYPNETPKSSYSLIRSVLTKARNGSLVKCAIEQKPLTPN